MAYRNPAICRIMEITVSVAKPLEVDQRAACGRWLYGRFWGTGSRSMGGAGRPSADPHEVVEFVPGNGAYDARQYFAVGCDRMAPNQNWMSFRIGGVRLTIERERIRRRIYKHGRRPG